MRGSIERGGPAGCWLDDDKKGPLQGAFLRAEITSLGRSVHNSQARFVRVSLTKQLGHILTRRGHQFCSLVNWLGR
jgi:hypothetical protein